MIVKREKQITMPGTFSIPTNKGIDFIVDFDDWSKQIRYRWRAKKKKGNWYAYRRFKRNSKTYEIALHRTIAHSNPNEEPHHKNHNTLDNRKINLKNVPHNKHPHY